MSASITLDQRLNVIGPIWRVWINWIRASFSRSSMPKS
jgi:hypothetical protein